MAVYFDYTKAKQGLFFGLSGPRLSLLAAGAVPAVVAFGAHYWEGFIGWTALWVVLLVVVTVPIRGRSTVGWISAATTYAAASMMGWTKWRSKAAKGQTEDLGEPDLPGVMDGIRVHDGPPTGPTNTRVAVIQDHANGVWAVTASITHPGLALADGSQRDSQARGLSQLLNACAVNGLVSEVHFMVRSVPDDGAERHQWLAHHQRADAPPLARLVNEQQVASGAAVRTEGFVTIVVPESRLSRHAKEFGRGIEARARALAMAQAEVEGHLRDSMQMTRVEWVTSPQLAVAVRTGFSPASRAGIVAAMGEAATNSGVNAGVPWAQAGPSGAGLLMGHYSHDLWNSVSSTLKLPATGAVIGALAPVLVTTEPWERRSMVVVYPVVSQGAAGRQTQTAESSADMAEALREKLGIRLRAKDRKAIARTRVLDQKMDAGNVLIRAYAVACVTVPNTVRIAEFGRLLDASIRKAGFSPLRLDVSQDVGFAAANIPLGIGLDRQVEL